MVFVSPNQTVMDDKELVEGCLLENVIFQEKLFRKFANRMMGIALRYLKSRDLAEDVVQEGFIKVFDNLKNFKFEGPLEAWITRIMVNTAISYYNKNKKTAFEEDISTINEELGNQYDHVGHNLQANDLLKLINMLPDGYKLVFNMFAIEGYSHKQIAQMLGITESTSKTQYFKARNYLKKLLEQQHLAEYE